jgi:hypothetical protein
MDVIPWLDRLEARRGPVLSWAVAVTLVAVALPPVLLWRAVRELRRAQTTGPRPRTGGPPFELSATGQRIGDWLPPLC